MTNDRANRVPANFMPIQADSRQRHFRMPQKMPAVRGAPGAKIAIVLSQDTDGERLYRIIVA